MRYCNYGGKSYGSYEEELEMFPCGAGSVEPERSMDEDEYTMEEYLLDRRDE